MAQRHELDLTIGDVFQIGETTITIIDIDDGEVTFRIDDPELRLDDHQICMPENPASPLPR